MNSVENIVWQCPSCRSVSTGTYPYGCYIDMPCPAPVQMVVAASMSSITNLISALGAADPNSEIVFSQLVAACMTLAGIDNGELASEFSASIPTVIRWRNGTNAPHPATREPVFKFLRERLEKLQQAQELAKKLASSKESFSFIVICYSGRFHKTYVKTWGIGKDHQTDLVGRPFDGDRFDDNDEGKRQALVELVSFANRTELAVDKFELMQVTMICDLLPHLRPQ